VSHRRRSALALSAAAALAIGGLALPAQALIVPLDTVPVGVYPYDVAVSPDGTYALVANDASSSVSRVDLTTRSVTATISVPVNPVSIVFNADGSKAYVASWTGNAITVIDTSDNSTTAVTGIPTAPNAQPFGLALTPDGSELIATGYANGGKILTISTATGAVTDSVSSGFSYLQGIDIDATGTTAYIGATSGDALLLYDLATDTVDPDEILGVGWASEIAITPDESEVWVVNNATQINGGSVAIYDVVAGEITLQFEGFDGPNGIDFSPDGSVVYISEYYIDSVTAFDFETLEILHEFPAGVGPYGVRVSPDGRYLYVPDADGSAMLIIGAIQRINGPDRFEVAVSISERAFPGTADSVFIASGLNYPDALSAGPVAAAMNGPLLLTLPTSLPPAVIDEIERLDPSQIYVVGGSGAVSESVRAQLDAILPSDDPVIRAGGGDRYETGRNVNEIAFPAASASVPVVYISTGRNFPDALSAGAAGAGLGIPVVLVNGTSTTVGAEALDLLTDWGTTQVKIAGGPAAVSLGIETQLSGILGDSNVERLSGADRYESSLRINQDAFGGAETAYIATGLNFPDALAGAALSAVDGAPLFVVPGTCIPQAMLDEFDALGVGEVVLLGGPGALTVDAFKLTPC
jgi:YVTN family beta-propeller protein